MSRVFIVSGLLGMLALVLPANLSAAEKDSWPQFRGPNRDGLSPDTGLLKQWPKDGPPLTWKAAGLGTGFSSVAVANGRIFTMGDKDDGCYVFAVDASNGNVVWSVKIGRKGGGGGYPGPRCTPCVEAGLVYALGQFGDLVCLEVDGGKARWRKDLAKEFKGSFGGWGCTESPLVDADKLVCTPGGREATLLALDKKTGDVIWKCPVEGGESAGYASIVVSEAGGVRQYVQLLSNSLVGVRAKDGKLLWRYGDKRERFAHNTANVPTPIVHGDTVFASAGYGRGGGLLQLIGTNGDLTAKELYFKNQLNNKHGGVVLVGEYLYGDRDDSGRPWCADLKTGEVKWQRQGGGPGGGSASLAYADGHFYVRYANGYVALVEATPAAYKEKSTFKIPNSDHNSWNHPVVIGGRLYLREKDVLWCYDVKQR